MDRERTLQVVLGEAEPEAGFLRFVLEGEGFDIVGLASTDAELGRVLRGARPDVIVLDAGISARAALEAKEQANGAALVVIWPGDVVAAIADEHVQPHLVVDDLGPAVRTASLRARPREERVEIPDTIGEVIDRWREAERVAAPAALPVEARPESPRLDRSARGVLIAALTWILVLTTLATIAVGVPKALDVLAGRSPGHPRPSLHPVPSPSPRTVSAPGIEPAQTTSTCAMRCSPRDERAGGRDEGRGSGGRHDGRDAGGNDQGGGASNESGEADDGGSQGDQGQDGGMHDGGKHDGGKHDGGNQDDGNQDGDSQGGSDQTGDGGQQQDEQGSASDAGSSDVIVSIA
jgi:hypothetical protein